MEEILAFLKNCKTFFVATTEDGKPKIRPFGFVMIYEGKLYFVTGNQKPFFKQIQANPEIEICAANEKPEWIRLSGKVVIDSRLEVKQKAFEVSPELVYIYQTTSSPIFECFYLEDVKANLCSFSTAEKVINL